MTLVANMVQKIKAKLVVELGCGDGYNAAAIMNVLPTDGKLFTVNWPNPPSGDNPQRYLMPWIERGDNRLHVILGDTRDPTIARCIPNGIDLLYIDSTHEFECAVIEWALYRRKLADRATVVVDDLDHNDMMDFWEVIWGVEGHHKVIGKDGDKVVGFVTYQRTEK